MAERLAISYLRRAEGSRCWSDYLKAHGLANYCLARDPRDQRYDLVYEIEKSWYNGNHPLTYSQHTQLTMKHKDALSKYRGKVCAEFNKLEDGEERLSDAEISNKSDLNAIVEFSNDVFSASRMCSEGFVEVTQEIMASSLEVLECSGVVAPCHYEVIALGSVAKGEATPYSDLEYAFIIEREDEYFTKLAVDSYFRIGNLGETPLGCFDIDEVKACSPPLPELQTVGYKIDGIKPKAGNIPTGRKGGQSLTLTVDGFMELYKQAAEAPFEGMAGDISDMLSSSVLVYSNQTEGSSLYVQLHQRILEYEQSTTREKVQVNRKRLQSFAHDIDSYNFLPEQSVTRTAYTEDIKVKVHIFRYPTLLANNFRICKSLGQSYPWETFDRLQEDGMLSPTNCKYLQIALALSIYIRTKAYMAMKTQCKSVSLLPSTEVHDSNIYHVPQYLFVILGCVTVPIKLSIRSKLRQCFELANRAGDMQGITKDLTGCIRVDETDFMLKAELLFFVCDFRKALVELDKGVGGSFVDFSGEEFIKVIRQKYKTEKADPRERKYLRLCAKTLKHTNNNAAAIDYYSWLAGSYARGPAEIAQYKSTAAECMTHIREWKSANNLLTQAITTYKEALGLDVSQDILQYLDSTVRRGRSLYDRERDVYAGVVVAYTLSGHVIKNMDKCGEAIQTLNYSLSICCLLLAAFIGSKTEIPDQKSIDAYISDIDINTCSSYVRHCLHLVGVIYNRLYVAHLDVGDFAVSMEFAFKALQTIQFIHGAQTSPALTAAALTNIGLCYSSASKLTESCEFHEQALTMLKGLYGVNAVDHDIAAHIYYNLGGNKYKMGEHKQALDYLNKAWDMYQVVHRSDPNHPERKDTCRLITEVHLEMGEYKTALQYSSQYHSMAKALYGTAAIHPDIATSLNLMGRVHSGLGNHTVSLGYHMKELAMLKSLFGADTNRTNIATCYLLIGQVHRGIGDYTTALEYSNLSQMMSEALGDDNETAKALHEMGICCTHLSLWKEAWLFLYRALSGCQRSRQCDLDMLASIHLSISELLFCLGNVSQSLEHAQVALDLTTGLLADEKGRCQKLTELNVKARMLVDSLQLIRVFQDEFVEL